MENLQIANPIPKVPAPAKRIFLSLGSNIGDRVANIRRALDELPRVGVEIKRVSSLYKTEPVDFRAQSWFVNCVVESATHLMPLQLLKAAKSVERTLGRRPNFDKGPRIIDIDILLYENAVVSCAALQIPHERLTERRFVLVPLQELDAGLRHPVTRQTICEMLQQTRDTSQVIRLHPGS